MNRILIVEDERPIANLIKITLSDAGYRCTCAYDGLEAANILERACFDLVLLDIMLPEIDGYTLFDYIRPTDTPVIFLTAKADVADKVKGLRLGAEDYLTKPFDIEELVARVETVMRRLRPQDQRIEVADIVVDTRSRIVRKSGVEVPLTVKEYEVLLYFLQNRNVALFRDRIYERVWHETYLGDSRTVDLHVQRLRKKLGWENKIRAVYKVGYRLEV